MRRARPPPRHCREAAAPARLAAAAAAAAAAPRGAGNHWALRQGRRGSVHAAAGDRQQVRAVPETDKLLGPEAAGREAWLASGSGPRLEGGPGDYSQCF